MIVGDNSHNLECIYKILEIGHSSLSLKMKKNVYKMLKYFK